MASFTLYLPLLTAVEGGFQNLEADNGNYNSLGQLVGTNFGISAPVYETFLGRVPSMEDVKAMKQSDAQKILKEWYWDKIWANQIQSQSVAELIADQAINGGVSSAIKMLQEVLKVQFGKSLHVDGIMGNLTLSALNSVPQNDLHNSYLKARENNYRRIGGTFKNSWLNRLRNFVSNDRKH